MIGSVVTADGGTNGNSTFRPFYFTDGNYMKYRGFNNDFDESGVILSYYNGKLEYSPLLIARYAVEIYHYWYDTNDSTPLSEFRTQIEWLRANESRFDDLSIWFYRYANPYDENQTKPWWSALANSFIVGAFINSYILDEDLQDLAIAWRGLNAYRYPMEEHGIYSNWDDTIWYEESAYNESAAVQNPTRILNGFIYALGAPRYVYEFNGSTIALDLFNYGIIALKTHMHEFDTGMWQRYSISNYRASVGYLETHRVLFEWAANITGDEEIWAWYNRTLWMENLPKSGLVPVHIEATNEIDPIEYGIGRTIDKQLYNHYWHAYFPANLTVDLGYEAQISFVGYFSPYLDSAPRNWSLFSGTDGNNWIHRATVVDSFEFDKAVVFNPSISARYLRFCFHNTPSWASFVDIDEIIISNPSPENLAQAVLSIEDHRFNHTYGEIRGSVPPGTMIQVDNGSWITSDGNYSFWLEDGSHYLSMKFNGQWLNQTVEIIYAATVTLNMTVTPPLDDTSPDDYLPFISVVIVFIVILGATEIIFILRGRKKLR